MAERLRLWVFNINLIVNGTGPSNMKQKGFVFINEDVIGVFPHSMLMR
jgi:hypothetical protein